MLWTPQDIFEHKQRWKPDAFIVDVHKDHEWTADHWVKSVVMKHKWIKTQDIAPYYNRYEFEELPDAEQFVRYLKKETGDLTLKVQPKKDEYGVINAEKYGK